MIEKKRRRVVAGGARRPIPEKLLDRDGAVVWRGDCRDVMAAMPEDSVDTIVTDPPYGLEFMGKDWDHGVPDVPFWRAALRVAKPGATALIFGGTRTYHRVACAVEDAGWEIRDCMMWVYGCLSDDTEILVDGRWEHYHKSLVGRRVLSYNTKDKKFSWQFVEETFDYDYDDTAYSICSDRTDQIVSKNHRCIVERGGEEIFQLAEDAAQEREATVPVVENLQEVLQTVSVLQQNASEQEPLLLSELLSETSSEEETNARSNGDGSDQVRSMRKTSMETALPNKAYEKSNVLKTVQRDSPRRGVEEARVQRTRGVDEKVKTIIQQEDVRSKQSSVEGRRNILQEARKLSKHQVRSLSGGIQEDGPQRRLRNGASTDCGARVESMLEEVRNHSPHQSRPNRQSARKSATISEQSGAQTLRASRQTSTTLARITPLHYKGQMWCVRVPTGAFVARRNGQIFITGNSGFPKSHNVSKAIDRKRYDRKQILQVTRWIAEARDTASVTNAQIDEAFNFYGMAGHWTSQKSQPAVPTLDQIPTLLKVLKNPIVSDDIAQLIYTLNGLEGEPGKNWYKRKITGKHKAPARTIYGGDILSQDIDITAPATQQATVWNGYGSALKPAWEPIIVAMKPLDGTFAENALKHGVSGLWIDGGRVGAGRWPANLILQHDPRCVCVGTEPDPGYAVNRFVDGARPFGGARGEEYETVRVPDGEREVWACVAGCPVRMLDGQSGNRPGMPRTIKRRGTSRKGYGMGVMPDPASEMLPGGFGDSGGASRFFYTAKASTTERRLGLPPGFKNLHPTVKPLDLCKYLCRLTRTPTGGTVLDPFAGSGSISVGAILEGRPTVAVEMESESAKCCVARIEAALKYGSNLQKLKPFKLKKARRLKRRRVRREPPK